MTLTLRAVSLNNAPLTQPITAHFDAQGGTIGRSNQNTLSLPDPERFISRQHAEIVAVGREYLIRNIGTSNPIMVRNQLLSQGESMPLAHRDSVRIGGYLLEVLAHTPEAASEAATVLRARAGFEGPVPAAPWLTPTGVPKTGPGSLPPELPAEIGNGHFELSPDNPFASLLSQPEAATPPRGRPQPEADHGLLPRDFDPFAPRTPAKPARPAAPPSADVEPLVPVARRTSIDDLIGPGSDPDPMGSFLSDHPSAPTQPATFDLLPDRVPEMRAVFEPPRLRPPVEEPPPRARPTPLPFISTASAQPQPEAQTPVRAYPPLAPVLAPAQPASDPLDLGDLAPLTPLPSLRPSSPIAPVTPAAPVAPPAPVVAVAPVAMPSAAPAAPAPAAAAMSAADAQALWAAFCRGADIQLDHPQACSPETMENAGALLRLAVDGILKLMELRQTTRYELHAPVTMIRPRDNNPLKFSPDAQAALKSLLQPPARGYVPGTTAMSDAMNDLIGHAMGTMAGTRAALDGVLGRFAPAELEAKLDGGNMLSRLVPMNRRSQLWELYLQHYQGIREEAQEDFHALFGKAFMAAYDQQLDRLHAQRAARGS